EILREHDGVVIQLTNSAGGIGTKTVVKMGQGFLVVESGNKTQYSTFDEVVEALTKDYISTGRIIVSPFFGSIENGNLKVASGSVGYYLIKLPSSEIPIVLMTPPRRQRLDGSLRYVGFTYLYDDGLDDSKQQACRNLADALRTHCILNDGPGSGSRNIAVVNVDYFEDKVNGNIYFCEANVRWSAVQAAFDLLFWNLSRVNQIYNPKYNPVLGSRYLICQNDHFKLRNEVCRPDPVDYFKISENIKQELMNRYGVPEDMVRLFNPENLQAAVEKGELPIFYALATGFNPREQSVAVMVMLPREYDPQPLWE
ncbi:MAG: hypothetical protein NZO16_02525, partial [Deltaproteobacteria bacterium]|nr:hypothetical protein [Deltaproteobacteria bacterium]